MHERGRGQEGWEREKEREGERVKNCSWYSLHGCLCSPLGLSACTNKPSQGLWSNGNQTCPRTKPPAPLDFPHSVYNQSSTDAHSSWRTHFNYPKQTWKYSLFPSTLFPHCSGSWRSTALHQAWPFWPRSSQTPLTHAYLRFFSLSHASSITPLSFHLYLVSHTSTDVKGFIGIWWIFHIRYSTVRSVQRDEMSQTSSSRSLAPRRCAGRSSLQKKVWMFSLWGFRVYQWIHSQSHCCPYLNVLFHKSMKVGSESDRRGEKPPKTHSVSTSTARLLQTGLIVIRLTDSAV